MNTTDDGHTHRFSAHLHVISICAILLTAACTSSIVKMGPDTYSVSSSMNSSFGGASTARNNAIGKANEFCGAMEKEILVTNTSMRGGDTGTADVTFRCLAVGDSELQRPIYNPAPTAVIEDRRIEGAQAGDR